jgi:UDP-N-acetyl-D-galactosamine dehydrogenase
MGTTFKENVADIRNSKVVDVIKELQSFNLQVDTIDAFANPAEFLHEYGIALTQEIVQKYDAIILAVAHKQYQNLSQEYFKSIANENAVFIDIKGIYRNQLTDFTYWSL